MRERGRLVKVRAGRCTARRTALGRAATCSSARTVDTSQSGSNAAARSRTFTRSITARGTKSVEQDLCQAISSVFWGCYGLAWLPQLPASQRSYTRPAVVTIAAEHQGTQNRRFEIALHDQSRVEAVLYRGDTLCISSQVGCAVQCPFCASGANGLARNLTAEELRDQVRVVQAITPRIERVTVSGIGEPLHNHDAVRDFVFWCRKVGLKPSLTTSGGPLRRLTEWLHTPHNGLTVSVHAGTESARARLVPKGPPLDALFEVLHRELPVISRSKKKKTALAYLLLDDENDSQEEVAAFVKRAAPLGLMTHLYAFNPVSTSNARRASQSRYASAYQQMSDAGMRVRMSSQARIEANGGCGTLVALSNKHHRMRATAT